MSNARGWGTGTGPEGVIPEPPVTPEDMINDIRLIRQKYVISGTFYTQDFDLTAFQARKVEMRPAQVNAIIFTVVSGIVFLYFGDYTNQNGLSPNYAHFALDASVGPVSQVIPIPLGEEWVFTVQEAAAATAVCTLIPMGL